MTTDLRSLAQSVGLDLDDASDKRAFETYEQSQELLRRLVELRRAQGYTQEAFAQILGISQSAVAKVESGARDPRLSTLVRYAMGLDVVLGHTIDGRPVANSRTSLTAVEEALAHELSCKRAAVDDCSNVYFIEDYRDPSEYYAGVPVDDFDPDFVIA
ncbi:helix-turn-helix domain-containing protein [Lapillicoccus jejuensis]|uniref:helix-turn-helix domain-containing protein n=1 Tax=Lapillicoccus jejuensis TaxID=402171 RepID=UPI00114E37D5|nr:helix-turn-helix transcriptional regulator [Lapillicoccus jejuensis]